MTGKEKMIEYCEKKVQFWTEQIENVKQNKRIEHHCPYEIGFKTDCIEVTAEECKKVGVIKAMEQSCDKCWGKIYKKTMGGLL